MRAQNAFSLLDSVCYLLLHVDMIYTSQLIYIKYLYFQKLSVFIYSIRLFKYKEKSDIKQEEEAKGNASSTLNIMII